MTNDQPRRKYLTEVLVLAQVSRNQHDRLVAAVPDADAEQFEVGTGAVDVSARLDVYDDVVAQSVQFGHRFDHTGLLGGRQGNRTGSNLEAAYEQTEAVCGHSEDLGGRHEVADQPCAEAEHSCVGLVNLLELHLSISECVALSALEHVYERRRELRLGVVSNLQRSSLTWAGPEWRSAPAHLSEVVGVGLVYWAIPIPVYSDREMLWQFCHWRAH